MYNLNFFGIKEHYFPNKEKIIKKSHPSYSLISWHNNENAKLRNIEWMYLVTKPKFRV